MPQASLDQKFAGPARPVIHRMVMMLELSQSYLSYSQSFLG